MTDGLIQLRTRPRPDLTVLRAFLLSTRLALAALLGFVGLRFLGTIVASAINAIRRSRTSRRFSNCEREPSLRRMRTPSLVRREPPSSREPHLHRLGQRGRRRHVEAQHHRAVRRVDMLTARARRAGCAFDQFGLVDADRAGDLDAAAWRLLSRPWLGAVSSASASAKPACAKIGGTGATASTGGLPSRARVMRRAWRTSPPVQPVPSPFGAINRIAQYADAQAISAHGCAADACGRSPA